MKVRIKDPITGFLLAMLLLTPFYLWSCSSIRKDYTTLPQSIPYQALEPPLYRIQGGDVLLVKFPYTEVHNEEVAVMPDGSIGLQIAGRVSAAGRTTEELSQEIRKLSSVRLRDPQVVVSLKQSSQKVYVGGEVGLPGVVPYREGITPMQAIFERGGFKDTANLDGVLVVRLQKDGYKTFQMGTEQVASLRLQANDVVYVPKTGIAKANLAIKQYIKDMIPLPIGASYSSGP